MVKGDGEPGLALDFPAWLPGYAAQSVPRDDGQRVPAPASGEGQPQGNEDYLYLVPGRVVVLPVPGVDDHGRLPDVLLRPGSDHRLRQHSADPERGGVWQPGAQYAPLGGPSDGGDSHATYDSRLLPWRL